MKFPMSILIGGISCVGKSSVARRLVDIYKMDSIVETDVVTGTIRQFADQNEHPEVFTGSYNAWEVYGQEKTPELVLSAYERRARFVGEVTSKILLKCLQRGVTTVGDGTSITPMILEMLGEYEGDLYSFLRKRRQIPKEVIERYESRMKGG